MDQNESLKVLVVLAKRILSELELLTSTTKAAALVRFQNDVLGTELQRKIYDAIDGEKDSHAIAAATGASPRAVQLLIKDLQEKDLIEVSRKSNAYIPSKSVAKIATYYAKLDIMNAGGGNNG